MNSYAYKLHAAVLAIILWFTLIVGALAHDVDRQISVEPQVVRILAASDISRRQLSALGLDLLEQRDGDELFAIVTPQQRAELQAQGWQLRDDPAQTFLLRGGGAHLAAAFPAGYRTVAETESFLWSAAANYPQLATVIDYGDSWEKLSPGDLPGHDLLAVRITSDQGAVPKPIFALMAAIHARELVTSELATRFISHLLSSYGEDAEITWLLNEHEVVVIPVANPDGRELTEQENYLLQRKNTNPGTTSCANPPNIANQRGVDLNRNSSFKWGTIDLPGGWQCSATFPGTVAASEPEVAALETFMRTLWADQRGPADTDAAPESTTGVMITLHSYSNLVLWPWGHTHQPAPNAAALSRLGSLLAQFNGYGSGQSHNAIYPTSGTTDDWLYGELGVPAFTFEVGLQYGQCGGFFPPHTCLDEGSDGRFWQLNLPALRYAARVASAPYTQPSGPEITAIDIISDTERLTVTATLQSRDVSEYTAAAVELYIDLSAKHNSASVILQPLDGALDSSQERVVATIPRAEITDQTLLLLRGQSDGPWGPVSVVWARSSTPTASPSKYLLWMPLAAQN